VRKWFRLATARVRSERLSVNRSSDNAFTKRISRPTAPCVFLPAASNWYRVQVCNGDLRSEHARCVFSSSFPWPWHANAGIFGWCYAKAGVSCCALHPASAGAYAMCQSAAAASCTALNPAGPASYAACQSAAAVVCKAVGPVLTPTWAACYAAGQASCATAGAGAAWTAWSGCYALGQVSCAAIRRWPLRCVLLGRQEVLSWHAQDMM